MIGRVGVRNAGFIRKIAHEIIGTTLVERRPAQTGAAGGTDGTGAGQAVAVVVAVAQDFAARRDRLHIAYGIVAVGAAEHRALRPHRGDGGQT